MPNILPSNIKVWKIYNLCKNQLIYAGIDGTPIDINLNSIRLAMERFNCINDWHIFDRVVNFIRTRIEGLHEERKIKMKLKEMEAKIRK